MLSKEVCKKCYEKHNIAWVNRESWGYEASLRGIAVPSYVICPVNDIAWIHEQPPENCPYALEHVMKTQNVKTRNLFAEKMKDASKSIYEENPDLEAFDEELGC